MKKVFCFDKSSDTLWMVAKSYTKRWLKYVEAQQWDVYHRFQLVDFASIHCIIPSLVTSVASLVPKAGAS